MIAWLTNRIHRKDDGYALVVAVILLFVMMILLVIGLEAGSSALNQSQRGFEWSRTLTVAENGVNDAITQLSANRSSVTSCPIGGGSACTADGGEYQVQWTTATDGTLTIESVGYFPTEANAQLSRHVRVTMEPVPTFHYALFAEDTITIKNNEKIVGDIYSTLGVTLGNGAVDCGSIVVANGDITIDNAATIVQSDSSLNCSGKSGLAWAGGSIFNAGEVTGDAKASAPTGASCSAASTSYEITGGTVDGSATACGKITGSVGGTRLAGTNTTQPSVQTTPEYVFDPANYPGVHCYPSTGTCGPGNTSSTAVTTANTALATSITNLSGTYAIWQTSPTQSSSSVVKLDANNILLSGDTTIVTNAPIDFGNTNTVGLAAGVSKATFTVISLYEPTGTCNDNGGDCSIYGKNSIQFDRGVVSDPKDGVVGLLYTTGKMGFKNKPTMEGALYAGAMDIKNGFGITYNSRIDRMLGFGGALEETLWEELDPS
jgi:hypothetical protein